MFEQNIANRPDTQLKRYTKRSKYIQRTAAAAGLLAGITAGHADTAVEVAGLGLAGAASVTVAARRVHTAKNSLQTATDYSAALKEQTGSAYPLHERLDWSITEYGATQKRTMDMRTSSVRYNSLLSSRLAIAAPVAAYVTGAIATVEVINNGSDGPMAFLLGSAACAAAVYGNMVGEKYFSHAEEITGYMMDNAEGTSFKA